MRYAIFSVLLAWVGAAFISCQRGDDQDILLGRDLVVYDSKSVNEALARKLADFLKRDGYLDDSGMRVRLFQDADSFIVQFVADTLALRDSAYLELVKDYTATLCREVFNGSNVSIGLSNKDFYEFARIPCLLEPSARRQMSRVEVKGNLLYFSNQVDTSDAMALVAYLVRDSFFTGGEGMIAEFDRNDRSWVFRFVADSSLLENAGYQDLANQYAQRLSDSLFEKAAVSVELCNRGMGILYRTP
jgi:hypothetical protein